MNAAFSFCYGEKEYEVSIQNGVDFELENGITVCVCSKEYQAFDAVEWVLSFENRSQRDSDIFSNIRDCDTLLPLKMPPAVNPGYRSVPGDPSVITMKGMVDGFYYWENDAVSAQEYGLQPQYLKTPGSKREFCNIHGRSSDGMTPFFDVNAGGNGYIVAIGWTGGWLAAFTREEAGIHVETGMQNAHFRVRPGEKLRTTSVLIMAYTDGENKNNKFRRLVKKYFSHQLTGQRRDGLMACELWGGLPSEEMIKRLGEFQKYDIRFEDLWLDAAWYGQCDNCVSAFVGDWSENTGNWTINRRVHPQELQDVVQVAKQIGMRLMLWFEPERAIQGTPVTLEHPEWFLTRPGDKSKLLDYGNEDAAQYIYELLSSYIEKLNMSCYRQDFNVALDEYFQCDEEPDRKGVREIKHITGMYRLWDRLLEAYPDLLIDNCSGGGRRIDLETLKRAVPFFRSDYQCNFNENPEVLQVHNTGISMYLPYNGCTSKTKSDTYAIRSSYSSSWGGAFYNAVFQSMDENDLLWAKRVTEEYRRIRRYFSMDFYNHGSSVLDDTAWAIWQYHDPESNSGIVMAFRRSNSPFDRVNIQLQGLPVGTACTFVSLNDETLLKGTDHLEIILPEKRSSVIWEYTCG